MHRCPLILLLVSVLLYACAPTVVLLTREPQATTTDVSTPRPIPVAPLPDTPVPGIQVSPEALRDVTVTVWHGLDGETGALFAQMASEFSASNSRGVKVQVLSQHNMSQLDENVTAALSAPDHPDLVLALPEQALAWDQQGIVVDLSPYFADAQFGFSSDEINDIPAAFLKQGEVNHRRLGLPAARTARFLFYNVSFARELGFDAPPQTADDFRKQACAANASWKKDKDQANDGYGGWVLDNPLADQDAPWTAYAWLRVLGGDVYVDGAYAFASPENQTALAFLAKLRADGCAWVSTAASNAEALAARKALFAAGSLDGLPEQRRAFAGSTDQWTVIPFPGNAPAIVAYGPDYVVLKSNETRQLAAWLFARWMLSPENQARWQRATGLFPLRTSAIKLLDNIRTADPQWAAAADLAPLAKIYPQAATWRKARLVLGDGFFSMFQVNPSDAGAARALGEMDRTVQDLLP